MKFHKVAHYFHVNKLSLHLDKTKIMLFYSNRAVQNPLPNVDVENPNLLHETD
jgi:hypothetical protein